MEQYKDKKQKIEYRRQKICQGHPYGKRAGGLEQRW